MSIDTWSARKLSEAKSLLVRVCKYQESLLNSDLSMEVIERSTPVVWFGKPTPNNWVTIATNPSCREFLDKDDRLLLGNEARFYVRKPKASLEEFINDNIQLESTIETFNSYFSRNTAYRNWFGKANGAN